MMTKRSKKSLLKYALFSTLTLSSSTTLFAKTTEVQLNNDYYVSASRLNLRASENTTDNSNLLGKLNQNDLVRVVSFGEDLNDQMIQIEIIKTSAINIEYGFKFFVSKKFLLTTKTDSNKNASKYFIIQNIATERLRVYKRQCKEDVCLHKMLFETVMVAGENKDKRRTYLGSYKITRWNKFYQDNAGLYPSWYRESYPATPSKKKGVLSWLRKKYMPYVNGKRKGEMRGAFGWYAGFVGPNSNAQWMHGTIGWGEKSKKFIKRTKGLFANIFSDPRSHGCSRVDNMAIAYLRHLLPVGTPVVKIYAKEALSDPTLSRYPNESSEWNYILTKTKNLDADSNIVLKKNVPAQDYLEEGTYEYDIHPDVIPYKKAGRIRNRSGKTGNVYNVSFENFTGTGVYYVDTGLIKDYKHPKSPNIHVGGYPNEIIPKFLK